MCFNLNHALAKPDDALTFSGFGRIVIGSIDEKNAIYSGYDNSIRFDQQSLIGLQANYKINNTLSFTGQFVGRTKKELKSGIEWLYATYAPNKHLQIKLGRQRTPFFNYSDSMDVGFAYPWITLPQQMYSSFLPHKFDGVLASYEFSGKELSMNVESYWGSFDDVIEMTNREVKADLNDFRGLISNLRYHNWTFRASYHEGDTKVEFAWLSTIDRKLRELGFTQSADSLRSNGLIKFYQLSTNYENLNYFLRSEFTSIKADFLIVPNIDSFLVSVGYNFYPFTIYTSYADSKNEYKQAASEIPMGLSPQLDTLAVGYKTIFDQLPVGTSSSFTLGARWDWKSNIAFKTEASWINGANNDRAFSNVKDPQNFDQKTILYQLAIEWVF